MTQLRLESSSVKLLLSGLLSCDLLFINLDVSTATAAVILSGSSVLLLHATDDLQYRTGDLLLVSSVAEGAELKTY